MKRISYSGGSFLTSDELADGLLSLTAELGRIDTAETVSIPIVDDDGNRSMIELVVGPASQLTSRPEVSSFDEPRGGDALDDLRRRVAELGPARPQAEAPSVTPVFDELDEL